MDKLIRFRKWLFHAPTGGPAATLLVRLMVGGVFVSEGIIKFLFPNQGVGRFTKLGFPAPLLTASLVGFWAVMHEIRSDYAQLMTALFLVAAGPGVWSLDALRARTQRSPSIAESRTVASR
jgi:uncharacterized membrane protein YphA (DoxX/SURF4 family)